ncbi:MAG: multidrug transporter [Faecalicoccus sp.]|nr:multidrug transporter [Faecalicoccus sp.]
MADVLEKDWKLFRKRIVGWQQAYIEKLCKEYVELLQSDKLPEERFWELDKRMRKDKRKSSVSIDMRRSTMEYELCNLLNEGAITYDDLEGFSDALQERIHWIRD